MARGATRWIGLVLAGLVGCSDEPVEALRLGLSVPSASVEPPAPPPPAGPARTFPFLPGEQAEGSISLGDTSHGRLYGGRALRESASLSILPIQRERGLAWGTDDLVSGIEHAAERLHAATGTKLWVGNLGREEGGDIPWSVSHNSGRDADVALSYLDAAGRPVDPPDLVPLGRDGWSQDRSVRLDARRTWTTVAALVEHPSAQVQYLFLSEALTAKVLAHARTIAAPARTVERARAVLRQPGGAAPHDDHLHVRVYCSARDVAGGCVDRGPVHPHVHGFEASRRDAARRATEALGATDAAVRARGLVRLGLLADASATARAVALLDDADAAVRRMAATYLGELGEERHAAPLVARFAKESDAEVLAALVTSAGERGGPIAGAFLRDLIALGEAAPIASPLGPFAPPGSAVGRREAAVPRLLVALSPAAPGAPETAMDPHALRSLAIDAAARADRLEPVSPLLALLAHPDAALAKRAADALARVTNHALWPPTGSEEGAGREAERRYQRLTTALAGAPRDRWLVRGFAHHGFEVRTLSGRDAWELVRAVAGPPHASYNARRVLARIAGEPASTLTLSSGEACRQLLGWVDEHRTELGVGRAPPRLRAACRDARDDP